MKAKRRLLFQILAVVLLVAIGYTMTIIGRGHTIYLDSKTLEYDGQTYKPAYKTVVYVDGQQVAKLYDKERGVATCIGQTLTVTLEITQQKGGTEEVYAYNIPVLYKIYLNSCCRSIIKSMHNLRITQRVHLCYDTSLLSLTCILCLSVYEHEELILKPYRCHCQLVPFLRL